MDEFDSWRAIEIVMLMATISVSLATPPHRAMLASVLLRVPKSVIYSLFLALIFGTVSTVIASSTFLALVDIGHTVIWVLAVFSAASILTAYRSLKLINLLLVLVVGFPLIRVLTGIVAALSTDQPEILQDWWLPFSNPRFVSQALVWVVPVLCVGGITATASNGHKYLLRSAGTAGFLILLLAGGRGALLAIAASIAITLLLTRGKPTRSLASLSVFGHLITAAALHLGVVLVIGAAESNVYLGEKLVRSGLSLRDVLWARAIQLSVENPIIGIGPGHYAIFEGSGFTAAHPHSLPLQLVSEWGIPAAGGFGYAIVYSLWRLGRFIARDSATVHQERLLQALSISIFASAILSWFDGVLVMPWSLGLGFIVCGLAMSIVIARRPGGLIAASPATQSTILAAYAALAFSGSLALAIGAWQTFPCPLAHSADGFVQKKAFTPRFWLDGRVPQRTDCS